MAALALETKSLEANKRGRALCIGVSLNSILVGVGDLVFFSFFV